MCVFRLTYMSGYFRINITIFAFCKQLLHGAQLVVCIGWNEWLFVKYIIFLDVNIVASLKRLLSIICRIPIWSLPQTNSFNLQTNTLPTDSSINNAHFTWNVFTITVSLYETYLMLLIEGTGFLLGVFLLWVILWCIEKHSGGYLSHHFNLYYWLGKSSEKNILNQVLIYFFLCSTINVDFKCLQGCKNTINVS